MTFCVIRSWSVGAKVRVKHIVLRSSRMFHRSATLVRFPKLCYTCSTRCLLSLFFCPQEFQLEHWTNCSAANRCERFNGPCITHTDSHSLTRALSPITERERTNTNRADTARCDIPDLPSGLALAITTSRGTRKRARARVPATCVYMGIYKHARLHSTATLIVASRVSNARSRSTNAAASVSRLYAYRMLSSASIQQPSIHPFTTF